MFPHTACHNVLQVAKVIAVIGAKDKKGHPVDMVGRYLLAVGYKVYPVHPVRKSVWGLPVYQSLAELPERVDIVNVFRASMHCLAHAKEIVSLPWKPQCFWMQLGIYSLSAAQLLAAQNIRVVEDLCIKMEHEKFLKA